LMSTSTWHTKPTKGYPKVVDLYIGCRRDQEVKSASNTRFRQVWATMCVIPYILFGGLYCLGLVMLSRGSLPTLIYSGGTGLHGILD
jgi:hypothetical protein